MLFGMSGKRGKEDKKEGKRGRKKVAKQEEKQERARQTRVTWLGLGEVWGVVKRCEEDDLQTVVALGACDGGESARNGHSL